ncbi:MAG: hypothetical protein H6978_00450 [Gammaproteobacteria bacterium]|nr:hypothetical protein [Gammaproteobacteria bacterium]
MNLYRVVDINEARSYDGLALIEAALTGVGRSYAVEPENFCANYTKEWRSWRAFTAGANRLPELTYADVSFGKEGFSLHYTNSLVNFDEPPELGSLHIGISVPETEGSIEHMLSLAKDLCRQSPFEYGYIHSLADNLTQFGEQKIRRTISGMSVRVDRSGTIWDYHLAAIRSGFLRSVYAVNLINESHLANPAIGKLLQRNVGVVSPFEGELKIWRLSEADLNSALEVLAESGSLIWHERGMEKFLAQPHASEVHMRMSPARADTPK